MIDPDATTSVAKFLDTHLPWIAQQEWAGEMVTEVGQIVRTLLARYPQAERTRHLADARCPECERTSMVYQPPTWKGCAILVQCEHGDCGAVVPEDRFGLYMQMIADDRKRELTA